MKMVLPVKVNGPLIGGLDAAEQHHTLTTQATRHLDEMQQEGTAQTEVLVGIGHRRRDSAIDPGVENRPVASVSSQLVLGDGQEQDAIGDDLLLWVGDNRDHAERLGNVDGGAQMIGGRLIERMRTKTASGFRREAQKVFAQSLVIRTEKRTESRPHTGR